MTSRFLFRLISGGLLVILPHEKAADFCRDIELQDGQPAWIIGTVEHGSRTARIVDDFFIVEVANNESDL